KILGESVFAHPGWYLPARHIPEHHVPEVKLDIVCNKGLWKGRRLDEKEPVVEGRGYVVVDAVQQRIGGHNIQHRQLCDSVGVVERHAVSNPPSAVVPYYGELLKTEMAHYFYLVERHVAFRVVGVILAIRWFAAVAIATQVGSPYGELPGQPRCDFVPHDVCLRVAVQEQHRRTLAARNYVDSCA